MTRGQKYSQLTIQQAIELYRSGQHSPKAIADLIAEETHDADQPSERQVRRWIEGYKSGRIPFLEPAATARQGQVAAQLPTSPATAGQEEPLSVLAQTGRRDFGVGPHLMWASLEIGNPNPKQALTDVQVRVIACDHVEPAQRWVDVRERPGVQRGEVIPNTFRDMGQFLFDWFPINLLWEQTHSDTAVIPPGASRTIIVAFSDNSNGPPAAFNDRAHTRAPSESRITVEVSSPEMKAWQKRFFINCHPNYISKDGLRTDSHFEFEPWETWASTRKVLSLDEALPDDPHMPDWKGAGVSSLGQPSLSIEFAPYDVRKVNLGHGTIRRFAGVRVENLGSQKAVGCRARLDIVEPSDWPHGDYKLNWKDKPYTAGSDTAPAVEISAGQSRTLDIAFTQEPGTEEHEVGQSKGGIQTVVERIRPTSVEPAHTEASLASYATGLPTIDSRHIWHDPQQELRNAFGFGRELPPGYPVEGCWVAIPIALSAPAVANQARLAPREYKIRVTVTCDNGTGDGKTFLLTSPQVWTDLDMVEVGE